MGEGVEVASGPLGDEIGCDSGQLTSCLAFAVTHGLLRRRVHERLAYWSVGDGTPHQRERDDDELGVEHVRHVAAPSPAPGTRIASIFPSASPDDAPEVPKVVTKVHRIGPKPPQTGTRARKSGTGAADEPQTGPLRIALWDDGVLDIRRGDAPAVPPYSLDETRAILAYLERLGVEERDR